MTALGAKFGVGRCGGMEKTSLTSLVGREADAATHGTSISGAGRWSKHLAANDWSAHNPIHLRYQDRWSDA